MKNVTGTRFALLNSVEPTYHSMDAVKAWETTLHEKTTLDIRQLGIHAGHKLFSCMLDSPTSKLKMSEMELVVGLSRTQCDALVKGHMLAAHADMSYTCAARHFVKSFQQLRMAQTSPSATTGASAAVPGDSA